MSHVIIIALAMVRVTMSWSELNCRALLQRMTGHIVLSFFTMASVSLIFGLLMSIVARLAI